MSTPFPPLEPSSSSSTTPNPRSEHLKSQITSHENLLRILRAELGALEASLLPIQEGETRRAHTKATIARHIKLLHDFNEVRDVGLHLIGMIADERGVRVQDVMPEFGVTPQD